MRIFQGIKCKSHVVKQMVPAGADEWMLEWDSKYGPSEHPEDQFQLHRIVLWLLVEHEMEQPQNRAACSCGCGGNTVGNWTQFSVEPWCHHHLDWWQSMDCDDFGCQALDGDERMCGPHAELENRRAEIRKAWMSAA